MALYDMTGVKGDALITEHSLVKLKRSSFAEQNIQERTHLQAALRDHIDLIDENLHIVAEEFGDFEGANRRIDLLCIDREGKLVVVELKRTADGGHMELQALRYAAMISTMTFSQVVNAFARYRKSRGAEDHTDGTARSDLLTWLDLGDDEEPAIPREVGIVLASENFSQEITTTVLWLNEFHAFDIRCIRLSPYTLGERLLLDVQHVIPLPEASAYTVRVREKETAVKQAKESSADWTKFIIDSPTGSTEPLPKRWAILRLVEGLHGAGITMAQISAILPSSKALQVDGVFLDEDQLWDAVQAQLGKSDENRKRWHLGSPLIEGDHTWVLNNNWGSSTRENFKRLLDVAPPGFHVREEGEAD
ncbi:endonuclease NucS domain-containing protein [Knoellia sp. LjRoot47]|uniref:endonuclease NucS domain-containing protein n=1 Tax=Knoellia sp. LjRoot47 TaxID=3342330 RepID=UPI003ECFEF05